MQTSSLAIRSNREWYKSIPMILTGARICLMPVVIIALAFGERLDAFVFFFIAEVTDILDGHLARRWGATSPAGAFLDTLADKVFHLPLFFYFFFYPKPALPHYFLIHDVINWIGYGRLFIVILTIEAALLASRFTGFTKWVIGFVYRFLPRTDYEYVVVEKKDAKVFGKAKTWIHAVSIGGLIVGIRETVSIGQVLAVVAIIFAFLSLQSRFTRKLRKRPA